MARICTLTISLAVLFFGIIPSILAEEIKEFAKIENDTLVIYGAKEKYPAPPKGISPEIARQLIRGEIPSSIASGAKLTKRLTSAVLPQFETTTVQTRILWSGEHWVIMELPPEKSEKTDWLLGILWLITPAFCILIASLKKEEDRKLIVFYIVIVGSILAAILSGWLDGKNIGVTIAMIIGGIAGGIAGGFGGATAGIFANMFASLFAGNSTSEAIIVCQEYVPFIILVCFLSFVITKLISKWKMSREVAG